jgi:hypothetical protein
VKYGTVSEYFAAVRNYAATSEFEGFRTYLGDFFPYADNNDAYWVGYYSSRANLKA